MEALERLGQGAHGDHLLSILRHSAPSWLAHLPTLVNDAERVALQQQGSGATQAWLMRELASALEEVTVDHPVILWLEDLHWSDTATIEFLAALTRRQEAARLLVIGTYRPLEMFHDNHPCNGMMHELHGHDLCHELRLADLREADVAQYLTLRFATPHWAPQVAQVLHQRSGGNPLFLSQIVNELVAHRMVTQTNEHWSIQGELATIATSLPDTIRHLVARQSERLCPEEQQVLEVASVAGQEFSAAAVAAAIECDVETIERSYQRLADSGYFLRRAGVEEWPDGTVTERYGFVHALYQQLWHERVTEQRRQQWHHRIGERLAVAYDDHPGKVAAELALHFEQGHDFRKAVQYRQHAAANATQRYAYTEAIGHLTAGLNLLHYERNPLERAQLELRLQTSLGAALGLTKGYSAIEVERAYHRARQLCEQLRETPQVVPILFGLWQFYLLRGEFQTAQKLAEQLVARTEHASDPAWLIRGYLALGVTWYYWGDLPTARAHLEKGAALSNHSHGRGGTSVLGSLLIACLAYLTKTLWYLSYPEQAHQRNVEMLSLVNTPAHPFSLAIALYHAACFHQLRRETALTQEQAGALLALQHEQRFEFYRARGTILHGWAQAQTRQHAAGIEQEYQSLVARDVIDAEASQPYFLAVLAETCGKLGRATDGLTLLAEALSAAQRKHTQIYTAELYRLTGELTLQKEFKVQGSKFQVENSPDSEIPKSRILNPRSQVEAEECFLKAIDIARQQQAKSLELRAVMSLVRLRRQQAWEQGAGSPEQEARNRLSEAHRMLSAVYHWFTEGFDTKDLEEAKALIEELSR